MRTTKLRWILFLGVLALGALVVVLRLEAERGGRKRAEGAERRAEDDEAWSRGPTAESQADESSEGGSSAEVTKRLAVGEDLAAPDISMSVFVGDAFDGLPVVDASVTLFDREFPSEERTDDSGMAVLPIASMKTPARMRVFAAGYCAWESGGPLKPSAVAFLVRGTTLRGRVLAADTGEPVGGAELILLGQERADDVAAWETMRTLTDSEGRYELGPVPLRITGTYEIRADGFATTRRALSPQVPLRPIAELSPPVVLSSYEPPQVLPHSYQDIHLVRGHRIRGRVEDWSSGRGVPGARVGDLTADALGVFEGRVLLEPATTHTAFDIRAPDYAKLHVELDLPADDGEGGAGEGLLFRLPRLAYLEGQVSSANGPVADAQLAYRAEGPLPDGPIRDTSPLYELPSGWAYSPDSSSGRSDAEGRYRLPVLPWGLNLVAQAKAPGFLEGEARFSSMSEPGSVRRLDFWLKPTSTPAILGGIVRLNGLACSGFEGTVSWRGPTRSGQASLEGGFYQVEVEPGDVWIRAALDICPAQPSSEVLARVEGTRSVDLDVRVPVAPITGRILFDSLRAAVGREVYATCHLPLRKPSSGITYRAMTNEHGDYELHVPEILLRFDIQTKSPGVYWMSEEGMAPGATGVDFLLESTFQVFLRATERGTGAVLEPGRQVRFMSSREGEGFREVTPEAVETDADGWLEFWLMGEEAQVLCLPLADELRLAAPGRARFSRSLSAQRHEFVFGSDMELRIELDAEPWPGDQELWLAEEDLWPHLGRPYDRGPLAAHANRRSVRFDEHGRATLTGLAPGVYRFKTRTADLRVEPEFVRLEPDTESLSIRWGWNE